MMIVIVEFELQAGAESEFETALQQMQQQVRKYDGFLGEAPCRSLDDEKKIVSLFYWKDRQSIKAWREDPEHVKIQHLGRERIFAWYRVRVCEIEREYAWERSD